MRKQVRKDHDGALTEIDSKALRREAMALRAYIEQASSEEEAIFRYRVKLLPLVEGAMNGTLAIPHKGDPYNLRFIMEGMEPDLPEGIQDLYFQFLSRIKGRASVSSTSVDENGRYIPDEVEINGQRYEWVEFED